MISVNSYKYDEIEYVDTREITDYGFFPYEYDCYYTDDTAIEPVEPQFLRRTLIYVRGNKIVFEDLINAWNRDSLKYLYIPVERNAQIDIQDPFVG